MSEIVVLSQDSDAIQYLCKKDKRLAKVIDIIGPITYKPHENEYHFLVDTIIGQMLSNKVADVMSDRLNAICKGITCPESIAALSDEELRGIGIAWSKVRFIRNLTEMVQSGKIDFRQLSQLKDAEVIQELTSIHGIGSWTAKMYLIFVLNRQNVLPFEDGAFLQGYGWLYKTTDFSAPAIKNRCAKWSPFASIAARYLYKALDTGLTKNEFHLYKQNTKSLAVIED